MSNSQVRNLQEMGPNLQKIVKRLTSNQNLLKLLYYTDKDPLNNPDLTEDQIKNEIFEKMIKVVPRVGPKENATSLISIRVSKGISNTGNDEFDTIVMAIEIMTPLTQWFFKDSNLRPFAIMGEISNALKGKTINGLGKIDGGDFELSFLTEEMSCYEMTFFFTAYD